MATPNRTCFICGKRYAYCPTCAKDNIKPSWYLMFDSETCMELNEILSAHTSERITTSEAKNMITQLNINEFDIRDDLNKSHIDNILSCIDIEVEN